MSLRLLVALAARSEADREIEAALKEDYPPGQAIEWRRGGAGKVCGGRVVMNCHGERIKVCNQETGRVFFIRAYEIV